MASSELQFADWNHVVHCSPAKEERKMETGKWDLESRGHGYTQQAAALSF